MQKDTLLVHRLDGQRMSVRDPQGGEHTFQPLGGGPSACRLPTALALQLTHQSPQLYRLVEKPPSNPPEPIAPKGEGDPPAPHPEASETPERKRRGIAIFGKRVPDRPAEGKAQKDEAAQRATSEPSHRAHGEADEE